MIRLRPLITLVVATIAASACETRVGLAGASGGTGTPTGPPGTGSPVQPAVVGEWSLILLNFDASGALVSSSETRWRFGGDGTASRSSIATSFASGIQEFVTTTGRWSATSSTITIELLNPPSGTLVLPWRVEPSASGNVLVLGTLRFLKR